MKLLMVFCSGLLLEKFGAKGREFAKCLVQNTFFHLEFSQIKYFGTINMPTETNNWDLETYRNKLENYVPTYLYENTIN